MNIIKRIKREWFKNIIITGLKALLVKIFQIFDISALIRKERDMKLFLKIVISDFNDESRDKRELSVVSQFNTEIIVIAKGENDEVVDANYYEIHRRSIRPLGKYKPLIPLNRLISIIMWSSYSRKLNAHCISCHDLAALFIGWLSTWFIAKSKKPLLVYDSHEFEIERNTYGKRSRLSKLIISKLEKFLMNKCAFSIMVNDSIADEVQRIHGLKERPIVVRNIPNYWNIDESVCRKRRQQFCEQLGIPEDTFIVMYHGGVMPGRGIETILKLTETNKNIAAVVLGYSEKSYLEQLKHMAEELHISKRVLFHSAVNIDDLWQYVGAADVGMVTIPPVSKSYYYMLPNKFFENIQSLTPIIGSDFPEISRIINKYDIGLLVNPENAGEIAEAIEDMRTNREMYTRFKTNLKKAKEELCWENESKVLSKAYESILR